MCSERIHFSIIALLTNLTPNLLTTPPFLPPDPPRCNQSMMPAAQKLFNYLYFTRNVEALNIRSQ